MGRFKSILASVLALVMVFLVSCGTATATKPPTYTTAQLEQIQDYQSRLGVFRNRITELETFIGNRDWNNVRSLIHGPLGQLRQDMSYISRQLLPKDQKAALQGARDIFRHLEAIDAAGDTGNLEVAFANYQEAVKDFDAFTALLPAATGSN